MIDDSKPDRQWQMGRFEDRACRQRRLRSAFLALIQVARGQLTGFDVLTTRTNEAIRPAPIGQRLTALIFAAIGLLEPRLAHAFYEIERDCVT